MCAILYFLQQTTPRKEETDDDTDGDTASEADEGAGGDSPARRRSSTAAAGAEARFAQVFDPPAKDDDVVLTPRGSHKPKQYLPANGKRQECYQLYSSFLFVWIVRGFSRTQILKILMSAKT